MEGEKSFAQRIRESQYPVVDDCNCGLIDCEQAISEMNHLAGNTVIVMEFHGFDDECGAPKITVRARDNSVMEEFWNRTD